MKKILLVLLIIYSNSFFLFSQDSAELSVQIQGNKSDSIRCTVIFNGITGKKKEHNIPRNSNNSFKSTLFLNNPAFITIWDGKNTIEGVLESGDDIKISYKANELDSTLRFSGRGSGKFILINEINNLTTTRVKERLKKVNGESQSPNVYFDFIDSLETDLMKKLDKIMFSISSSSYNLLKGEIKGLMLANRYQGVQRILKSDLISISNKSLPTLSEKNNQTLAELNNFLDAYYLSPQYLDAVFNVLAKEYDALTSSGKKQKEMPGKFQYFDDRLKGQLKVPVHTKLFLEEMNRDVDQLQLYAQITQVFENNLTSEFKPFIEKEYALFKLGKKAPSFSVLGLDGKKINLEDLRGKVVYLNFWFSGNTGCEKLFNKLKVVMENFKENQDVVFLMVSVDSKELWTRSSKYYGIKGLHGYTEDLGMKHPVISTYQITKFPTSCIIDRKGNFYSTLTPDNPLELIHILDGALKEQLVMSKSEVNNKNAKN